MIFCKLEQLPIHLFSNNALNDAIKHTSNAPIEELYLGGIFEKKLIEFKTAHVSEKQFEAHREYIDIHIVLEGKEYFECVLDSELVNVTEYDADKDILFGDFAGSAKITGLLESGYALVCFPNDAHLVGAHIDSARYIKKVVYKVPYSG